jgi:hypothetical protein
MNSRKSDRELGMHRKISRRDFINGVAVGVGGLLAADPILAALTSQSDDPKETSGYYPPALTGMRGNHDGSFAYAHRLRDGESWDSDGVPRKTDEVYDLVVVGGGISGLAAAYFYKKQAGEKCRILVLDNHDDFGGHAKRNEFQSGGRMLLSYGGTQSIESPGKYSDVARGVLKDLGIDTSRSEALQQLGHGTVFRSRNIRRRSACPWARLNRLAAIPGQMSPERRGSPRHCTNLYGESRLPAGFVGCTEASQACEDQLRRLPHQNLQSSS